MASVTQKKLEKRLRHQVGKAIMDYGMIEANDKIMVCLSGGKDSYAMLDLLLKLKDKAPVPFELVAVNLDQKQPGFPADVLPNYLSERNIPYHILTQDTYSVVKRVIPEGKTTCGLCSRLRRGILYQFAKENQFTKIALGHHRDDIVETFFMNLFFGSTIKAMPPKLLNDQEDNIIIRPLSYCAESDLAQYAKLHQFPIIPCHLCGSQDGLQRQEIKQMLQQWEQTYAGRTENIFRGLTQIRLSQLADTQLFDFKSLRRKNDPESPSHLATSGVMPNWLA